MEDKVALDILSSSPYAKQVEELIQTLPQEITWKDSYELFQYQGFWYPFGAPVLSAVISFQKQFKAHDTDIFLVSIPKSGTTWLKALVFSIFNRNKYHLSNSPLLKSSPHDLVPFVELDVHARIPLSNPRILATHIPHVSLPASVVNTKCRIVYLCRNPLDQFISAWHFVNRIVLKNEGIQAKALSIEECFEKYCRGISGFGPFWDHVLGYWKMSLGNPNKVLFMKYEELKNDTQSQLRKLAEFLGYPFSEEEMERGEIEEIIKLCSFEKMKNLDANKSGTRHGRTPNTAFFRKAEVGDWVNYLSPSMAGRMKQLLEEKFGDSGLQFDMQNEGFVLD